MNNKERLELDRKVKVLSLTNRKKIEAPGDPGEITSYDKHNKLNWLLLGPKMGTDYAKNQFAKDWNAAIKADAEYCKKHGRTCKITPEQNTKVLNLLDRCGSFFEVEALARFIYDEAIIPKNFEYIQAKAAVLYNVFPIYHVWNEEHKGNH